MKIGVFVLIVFAVPAAIARASGRILASLPDIGPVRCMPQRAHDRLGSGCLDRFQLALQHDGQFFARSVLAGKRPARDHRSPPTLGRHRG